MKSIDADQDIYDRGFRVMPGWDAAQEIRPIFNILSRVDLYITSWGDPWGPTLFQICEDSPNGNVVYVDLLVLRRGNWIDIILEGIVENEIGGSL